MSYYDVFWQRADGNGLNVERHVMIDDGIVARVIATQNKTGKHRLIYRKYAKEN